MRSELKHIFLLFAMMVTLGIASCLKDDIEQSTTKKVYDLEDFESINTSLKNGSYAPFHFPYSLTEYDVFKTQITAYNHTEVERVNYERISLDQHNLWGNIFNPYKVKYSFVNGTDTTVIRLCPEYLGDKAQRTPNNIDNQLDAANPEIFVLLTRSKRYDMIYVPYCGGVKYRFYWDVLTSSNQKYYVQIEPNCGNWIDYQFIL
jgi:hypothetical protein